MLAEGGIDSSLATAEEIPKYAEEEFERALKTNDVLLYRNAAGKAFLAVITAVNHCIARKLGATPQSHAERRSLLRKMGRERLGRLQRRYEDAAWC